MALPIGLFASSTNDRSEEDTSTCKIKDKIGTSRFRAKGDCEEVAAAYAVWREAQG